MRKQYVISFIRSSLFHPNKHHRVYMLNLYKNLMWTIFFSFHHNESSLSLLNFYFVYVWNDTN